MDRGDTVQGQQQVCSEGDSEEDSFLMGDLLAPGSERLQFGTFDKVELRKVSCIAMDMNPQIIINEYGTNLMKQKLDPLVTIEAKNALHGCKAG